MAYEEPNDNEPDADADEYRRQQMKALQQPEQPPPDVPPGITTQSASEPPPNLGPTASSSPEAIVGKKITEARGIGAPAGGAAPGATSAPPAAPGPAGPPKVTDPESVKQWVISEAKRLGRPDIAGNPDYWVQQAIAHSDKGDGTVDTGYWSNRMQIANKGGGGIGAAMGGMMTMPAYLGGAGAIGGGQQVAPGQTSDTMKQVLAELAASQTGQQSPLARRLQMQQLQDVQDQTQG